MTVNHQEDTALHPADHRNAAEIARRLTRRDITTGDMAGLRRLDPRRPTESAFWRVCSELGIDQSAPKLVRSWAIIFRMIAAGTKVGDTQTDGPHDGNLPLGKALAQGGYSQNRLKTLLDAEADRALAHRRDGWPISCTPKVRSSTAMTPRGSSLRRTATPTNEIDRTRIARDYYRQLHQQERQ